MTQKIIKRYISQRVTGYSRDFKYMYLRCVVEYTDGTTDTITEERETERTE